MSFPFGATQNKPLFGTQPATSTGTGGFGGFGSGFGNTTQNTGFGSTATSTGTGTATGTGFGGFGGGFGTSTTSTGTTGFGFGAAPTSSAAPSGFGLTSGFNLGTALGSNTSTSTLGSGFNLGGTGTSTGLGGFNTQQQQQQQQQQQAQGAQNSIDAVASAVIMPILFGDERDAILTKWNQLQAYWGTGKGFYNNQGQHVSFTSENPFCRFKAVGYSVMPSYRNKDGLVALFFKLKAADVEGKQTQIVDTLHKILGNKPNIAVCVEGVKELPDNRCEMQVYIQERSSAGTTRRIPSSEVSTFMSQQNISSQLQTQLQVENVLPKIGMSKDTLKNYLDNPPAGIDPLIWQQAKLDNPDPEKFIPVPMVGFTELHSRLKHQENQTKLHQARLDVITSDIATLQRNHANMLAKTEEYKRRFLELSHRVLQVLVKQEISRKMGYAIQADEEQLRVQLEAQQAELNAPTQFKGRLNELMSQIRMQNQLGVGRAEASYQMDEAVQLEIKQHLHQQQDGLKHLISIIKDDLEDLKLIEQGLGESHRH